MDCKTVRERIEADPAHLDEACAEHAEQCAACTAFAERVRNAEWMIHEALRFDVAALKRRVAGKPARRRVVVQRRTVWTGVAMMFLVGVAVWLGIAVVPVADNGQLVAEVLEHWYEEPQSWVQTDVRISPASLEEVLNDQADVDMSRLGLLSYAQSCLVRGEWIPHLVVQGERGPIMLLLLPHERVTEPVPLELPEEGLSGVIVPLGEGSVAVMGEEGEPLELIRERLAAAVEWSI